MLRRNRITLRVKLYNIGGGPLPPSIEQVVPDEAVGHEAQLGCMKSQTVCCRSARSSRP